MINIFTSNLNNVLKCKENVLYSIFQEKENSCENVSQIINKENYFLSGSFVSLRNNAFKRFLSNPQEAKFIYINADICSNFKDSLEAFEKEDNKFFIDEDTCKIQGFVLSRKVIEFLGGFSFLSEILIDSRKEDLNAVSISNEELDWNYLIRYIKLFDFFMTLKKEPLYDIEYLNKILDLLQNPYFFRKNIKKIPESSYYMFYFNTLSYYKTGLSGLDNMIEKFTKKFLRLKESVLTNKIRAAQDSFIKSIFFINPID